MQFVLRFLQKGRRDCMRYDMAIIGTGPAGLEAAITASIRKKKILLIGTKDISMKVTKAHAISNYLGLPDISGYDLARRFQEHLQKMNVLIHEDQITAVYSMGGYFALQGARDTYESTTVILATGVVNGKPYPCEERFLGRGVSYCATCDGAFYKDRKVAVIGGSPKEEQEAEFLTSYASKVLYFPLYHEEVGIKNDRIEVHDEMPKEIMGEQKVNALLTDKNTYAIDGIFILRDALAPAQLVPGIQTNGAHVVVAMDMSTSIPGIFAAGDIAGLPYQYIKSAGQGNVAALSAVSYLTQQARAQKA